MRLAFGLKAVFLATTLSGVTTLWMAILADTGATVLVTRCSRRRANAGQARPKPFNAASPSASAATDCSARSG
ncbi:MAG: hypothetical protein EOR84_23820 [Mesorhizobium sp.]|nr:MAG: hypothetical protein EOR84_23820 [Mesorhizobium sp.]